VYDATPTLVNDVHDHPHHSCYFHERDRTVVGSRSWGGKGEEEGSRGNHVNNRMGSLDEEPLEARDRYHTGHNYNEIVFYITAFFLTHTFHCVCGDDLRCVNTGHGCETYDHVNSPYREITINQRLGQTRTAIIPSKREERS
jgi:hypothetical protein